MKKKRPPTFLPNWHPNREKIREATERARRVLLQSEPEAPPENYFEYSDLPEIPRKKRPLVNRDRSS